MASGPTVARWVMAAWGQTHSSVRGGCLTHYLHVIGWKGVVAGDGDHRSSPLYIVLTPPSQPSHPGEVGVVSVGGQAEQLDVVVAQLGDGAAATSCASAVERVGGAGRHLGVTMSHQGGG